MKLNTCLIPAAGRGIRARPHTRVLPKAMLPVGGKPVLQNTIEMVRDQLGITNFIIIVGHLGTAIEKFFKDGAEFGVYIRYVENHSVDKGLTWSVYLAREYIQNNFLMILGDELYLGSNHHEIIHRGLGNSIAVCGLKETKEAQAIQRNYAVKCSEMQIDRIFEKPEVVHNNLMGTGTILLSHEIFSHIHEVCPPESDCIEFFALLDSLCRKGYRIERFMLTGNYVNINTATDLAEANRLWKDNK